MSGLLRIKDYLLFTSQCTANNGQIVNIHWFLSIELEICADIDDFISKNIHLLEFLSLNRNCVEFTQGTLYVVPHHQNLHKRKSN